MFTGLFQLLTKYMSNMYDDEDLHLRGFDKTVDM